MAELVSLRELLSTWQKAVKLPGAESVMIQRLAERALAQGWSGLYLIPAVLFLGVWPQASQQCM